MYIRRKVFSILDTEIGERLFSTTDYILDQREFTGETKRRNKALKRQWLEKLGEEEGKRIAKKDNSIIADINKGIKRTRDSYNTKFGQKGAGDVALGRIKFKSSQNPDELAWRESSKKYTPNAFKLEMEKNKREYKLKKMGKANSNPEVVVPERALVVSKKVPAVSNPKPVIKTESKLSKLAKNKYVQAGAGLLVLGGTAAGGYYLLNKKNKKDKEDRD